MPSPIQCFGGLSTSPFGYNAAHFVGSSGTDTWSNSTNSATPCSLATAITNAGANDVVFIMDDGTYTLTSTAVFPGGSSSGFCVFAGTANQNGADANGGWPLLDADSNNIDVTSLAVFTWLEHLEITGSGDAAGAVSVQGQWVIWDCDINTNGGFGLNVAHAGFVVFADIHANSAAGVDDANLLSCFGCHVHDNSGRGMNANGNSQMVAGCVIADNVGIAILTGNFGMVLFNTIDGGVSATDDAIVSSTAALNMCLGNIISNFSTGGAHAIDAGSEQIQIDVFNHTYNVNTASSAAIKRDLTTGDPDYAGDPDFSLGDSSTASDKELGTPFSTTNPFVDKGAIGREEPAGGGGGGVGVIIGG